MMYSDNAKEIINAVHHYHILCQHSQPGISKSNAVAERANRDVEAVTRTLLGQAGLPACFWPLAAPCASCLDNVRGGESSPYQRSTGEIFSGELVPFGARCCSTQTRRRVPGITKWSRARGSASLLGIPSSLAISGMVTISCGTSRVCWGRPTCSG